MIKSQNKNLYEKPNFYKFHDNFFVEFSMFISLVYKLILPDAL